MYLAERKQTQAGWQEEQTQWRLSVKCMLMKDVVVRHGVSVQCAPFSFFFFNEGKGSCRKKREKETLLYCMSWCFIVILKFEDKKNIADLLTKSQNPSVTAEI